MRPRRCGPVVAALMALLLVIQWVAPARAQQSGGPGVVTAICTDPGICFKSKEARQQWAKDHNCQFLEDVCEKTPASEDNKGAKPADQGFWSGLWDKVSSAVQYGYEFSKGLFNGLKGQIADVIELISDPMEVAAGLVKLGKAFYDDPKGTLAVLGQLLGQEAVDTITKATQCGAYDLGNVIGSYVSPAVALKLAIKLGKFTGKLSDAVKATKADLGCASFGAGTLVHAGGELAAIEAVRQGALVDSRDEVRWTDAPQRVTNTFGRVAPSHRELLTELEAFRITDEHPLWVQGKGWTPAKDVAEGDVLAAREGDLLVRSNAAVGKPLVVHNFSVANTPNYFVGEAGLWAHNATKCNIPASAAKVFEDFINGKGNFTSPNERIAVIRVKLTEVAQAKGWKKENGLTEMNKRIIYKDPSTGGYWAFDTQHGRFEKLDKKGRHQGEYDIDLKFIEGSIDDSGGHDIKLG